MQRVSFLGGAKGYDLQGHAEIDGNTVADCFRFRLVG